MKNKLSPILSIAIGFPILIISLYFLLKNSDSTNILLSLAGLGCMIGSFTLIILTFYPLKGKGSSKR